MPQRACATRWTRSGRSRRRGHSMRRWARVLCVVWACHAMACSDGRGTSTLPSATAPSVTIEAGEPGCGLQSFPDPPLFGRCDRPVARLCPLPPEPDGLAVYSAGSCLARPGETCAPQPYPVCFTEHFSAHVLFVPPAEGLCATEMEISLTGGTAQWRLQEFAPVAGRCRLVSTTDGERDLVPCCLTLVGPAASQAAGDALRLAFDCDWARR